MKFLPSCHDVQMDLTEYIEGSLSFRKKIGIWVHLRFCRVCSGFLRGLQSLSGLSKMLLTTPAQAPESAKRLLAQVQASFRKQA